MARRTAGHDAGVIERGSRKRCRGLVTILTGRRRRDVIRWFTHNPDVGAAMTGRAPGRDADVVHRRPGAEGRRGFVAGLAPLRGGNVGGRLA